MDDVVDGETGCARVQLERRVKVHLEKPRWDSQ